MVQVNFKQIDLLSKRRESNNLPDPYFIDTRKYIKKGIYSGVLLILISLSANLTANSFVKWTNAALVTP